MLYVIGDYNKHKQFLHKIISGLNNIDSINNASEVQDKDLDNKAHIETKYYQTNIDIKYKTITECINFDNKLHNLDSPNAILLLINEDVTHLNLFDELNKACDCKDITRLCSFFYSKDNQITNNQKNKLIEKCNLYHYELISISMSPEHSAYLFEDCEFTYNDGILRTIQALQCTNWKINSEIHVNNDHFIDLQDSFHSFDLLTSAMRKLNSENKYLNDNERREKASEIVYQIVKHFNLDLDE